MARYRRRRRRSENDIGGGVVLLGLLLWSKVGTQAMIFYIVLALSIGITAYVLIRKYRRKRLLESGIDIIDKMDGKTFEKLLQAHFAEYGYKCSLTPDSNDYGADLVLKKDDTTTVVQAKRYESTVGIEAVQQVIGAIRHYKADRGMVITNSFYTQQAQNLASSNGIELWDRARLINSLRELGGREIAENVSYSAISESEEDKQLCPKCNGQLVKRKGSRGNFLGCVNYPSCRYTKDI